jgi:hypothetical protein
MARAQTYCVFLFVSALLLPLAQSAQAETLRAASNLEASYFDHDLATRMASLEAELEMLRRGQTEVTAGKAWDVCSCYRPGLILAADVLWIRPRRTGLDFAISDPNTDNNVEGPVESLELDSGVGVRGAIGYRTASGWDAIFTYTHLDTDTERTVVEPENGVLWLTRTAPASSNNHADLAQAVADLNYDVFDLEAGYTVWPAASLPIRLFGGFRAAAIEQNFGVRYVAGTVTGERVQHQSTQVDGYGLRGGAETQWLLGRGWSVFGRAAGSVLVGEFSILHTEDESGFPGAGNVDVTYRYHDVLPMLDAAAGLSWQSGRLTWQVGYELTAVLNLDHPVNFAGAETINRGQIVNVANDLVLEGLFARLICDF